MLHDWDSNDVYLKRDHKVQMRKL